MQENNFVLLDKNKNKKQKIIEDGFLVNASMRDYIFFNCKETNEEVIKSIDSIIRLKEHSLKKIDLSDQTLFFNKKLTRKKRMLRDFGVENNFQRENIKRKIKKTNIEKYGVSSYTQTEEYIEKTKKSKIKNYDDPNYNNREKAKKTLLKKIGVEHQFHSEDILLKSIKSKLLNGENNSKIKLREKDLKLIDIYIGQRKNDKNIFYKIECLKCNTIFEGHVHSHIPKCPVCFPKSSSVAEKEIKDFISSLNIKYIENDRTILNGKEIDIYLSDYNLGIEYNGLYYHSEQNGKTKYYHLEKTKEAKEKGIDLIHIFEDEWRDKKEIVKSIIKSKIGIFDKKIFARKCFIKEINLEEERRFLKENHIQGYIPSSIKYGLYYENELISIMTFGKSRYNKKVNFEMLRFCNKLNYSVIGGASKLFKYFVNNNKGNIISYSDKRYFDGKIYSILGFNKQKDSYPNYYYLDSNYSYRFSRIEFQKHKLKNKLNEFDENLTEYENMLNNGYDRIWDCGNSVFIREI
ncbi:MAG: DUF7487 domain-containing protein [bacterium]